MKIKSLSFLAAIVLSSFGWTSAYAQQTPYYGTLSTKEEVQLLRAGGLRAVAKRYGHYVTSSPQTSWAQYKLEALVQSSDLIVEAIPTLKSTYLAPNGEQIFSRFSLLPRRVLKANDISTENLIIEVIGGKVTFEDGTSAEVAAELPKDLANGGSFLFFLKKSESGLIPIGDYQGVISMNWEHSTVAPHAQDWAPVSEDIKGLSPQDLLEKVDRLVHQ